MPNQTEYSRERLGCGSHILIELIYPPLAIVQVAVCINENGTTLVEYLLVGEWEERAVDVLTDDVCKCLDQAVSHT